MREEKRCLVGRDDDASGVFILIMIGVLVLIAIVALVVYGGAFIGGFHSLKNYFISFKNNVIDDNFNKNVVA